MGRTIADGYLELRLDPSKLDAETKKAFKEIGFRQRGQQAGEEAGTGLAAGLKSKISGGFVAALGAVGLGAGIGAGLTSGITQALDVGKANDKLRAQLNLTKDESAKLGQAAGQLYSKGYGESLGEVNEAISSVIRNVPALRNASVPVLKEISGGALDIARVFDQDVAGVTGAVASLMKSGLAPDANAALDIISKGFQKGLDKGGDLLDTLTEYSVQFKKVGLDGEQSLGVINQLLAGGARNSDLAADAVKEFTLRSIDGSKGTVAAYKTLNLDAAKMAQTLASGGPAATAAFDTIVDKLNSIKDPVARNTAGVQLFGTKFEDLGDAFRNLDVSATRDDISALAGTTKGLADQSDSARIQGFVRSIQTGFVGIIGGQAIPAIKDFAAAHKEDLAGALDAVKGIWADVLLPALRAGATFLTGTLIPAIGSLIGWLREHDTVVKTAAIVAGTLFAVYKAGTAVIAVQAAGGLLTYLKSMNLVTTATKIWTGVQAALNLVLSLNPIGLVVLAIGALIAIVVLAYKNSDTFRAKVQAAWAAVKSAISAVGAWFTGTLWPSLQRAYGQLISAGVWLRDKTVGAFRAVRDGIQSAYAFIRDKVFSPLGNFLTKTIPDAFRTGTSAIGKIWEGLQDLAKKPVRFVVDTVINQGIIGTFNKVSDFFGGPKASTVSLPAGFGDGHGHGGAAPKKRTGDGFGLGDIGKFVSGPVDWVKGKIGGFVDRIGDNPFAQMLKGMAGKLVSGVANKAKGLLGSSEYGGEGSGVGGLQGGISGVLGALRGAFGSVPLISGLRPGATTLSGRTSYHASGRAIDIAPVRQWAEFIHTVFGPRLKELITPWQDLNLLNGRQHTYTGAVWNQHNFPGGNAHIHAAMDDGGMRMLRPGYNVIPNWTGAMEPIAGPNAMAAMSRGNTYNITINVPPTAHPAEVGKAVVGVIQAYEQANGKRWRR